jgi:hypothetical protein
MLDVYDSNYSAQIFSDLRDGLFMQAMGTHETGDYSDGKVYAFAMGKLSNIVDNINKEYWLPQNLKYTVQTMAYTYNQMVAKHGFHAICGPSRSHKLL